ncbi:hypothetical protein CVT26_015468 [Gymnopilus dilepis]|uniref:F-box domain-containing protein n=1 Tax=Gymnopilus dilepis TaxID=231916 RepID=A0A409WHR3_9AGAR|nr:hypothetical protein CVT26_015468 [Gymnopilus dilepis]
MTDATTLVTRIPLGKRLAFIGSESQISGDSRLILSLENTEMIVPRLFESSETKLKVSLLQVDGFVIQYRYILQMTWSVDGDILLQFCLRESIQNVRQHAHRDNTEDSVTKSDFKEANFDAGQLDTDLHRLQTQRAFFCRLRNQHSPAVRLPTQILANIFLHFCEADNSNDPMVSPLVLGKVCHAWRLTAWNLPEIWSTVNCCLSKRRYLSQVILLEEWLGRSSQELLSLSIKFRDEEEWCSSQVDIRIFEVLLMHCNRWKHLCLIVPLNWHEKLGDVEGKVPNLVELSLRPLNFDFVIEPLTGFSNAPKLHKLHASNYYLQNLNFPWARLTSGVFGGSSMDEALEVIRRCPNLTMCHFDNLMGMEATYSDSLVTNHKIQSLKISMNSSARCGIFLISLTLPRLQSLTLSIPEGHPPPLFAIEGLLDRSRCRLKVLHIKGPFIDERDLVKFLIYNDQVLEFVSEPSARLAEQFARD